MCDVINWVWCANWRNVRIWVCRIHERNRVCLCVWVCARACLPARSPCAVRLPRAILSVLLSLGIGRFAFHGEQSTTSSVLNRRKWLVLMSFIINQTPYVVTHVNRKLKGVSFANWIFFSDADPRFTSTLVEFRILFQEPKKVLKLEFWFRELKGVLNWIFFRWSLNGVKV